MKSVTLILSVLLWFSLGCEKFSAKHDPKVHEVSKAAQVYYCPMHPQITSERPGSCSICGMDLVVSKDSPKSEAGDQGKSEQQPIGRSTVELSLDKRQLIGVKSSPVQIIDLYKSVRAPGRIAFDPALYTAQNEYVEALRQWRQVRNSPLKEVKRSTKEMIKSSKIRLQVLGMSPEQINKIAKSKNVSEGLIVGDGQGDNLIYADVFESDLANIQSGQSVTVEGSFLEGRKITGQVIAVDQVIDPRTRTGKVRISIEKTKASIRPEAFVNVAIAVPLGKHIAVPLESIFDTGRELYVFIDHGEGKFEPRIVTKLFETDNHMAISTGIAEGQKIVSSANFLLDSESRLKSVIKKVSEHDGHNH